MLCLFGSVGGTLDNQYFNYLSRSILHHLPSGTNHQFLSILSINIVNCLANPVCIIDDMKSEVEPYCLHKAFTAETQVSVAVNFDGESD